MPAPSDHNRTNHASGTPTTLWYAPQDDRARRHILIRIGVIIGGTIVLLVGIALIVLPGPAFVVIPAGLAILGTELVWARRLLHRVKRTVGLKEREMRSATPQPGSTEPVETND